MKLLRIIRSIDPSGGGPIAGLIQSTPYLSFHGIDTTVVTLDSPRSPFLNGLPFPTLALGPVIGSYGYKPGLLSQLRTFGSRFDAVTVEGLWQYHSFLAWRAFSNSSVPYYVYPHGMLDPWFKNKFPIKHLKKSLYWSLFEYRLLRDSAGVLFTTPTELHLARQSFRPYRVHEYDVGYGASPVPQSTSAELESFYLRFPSLINKNILIFFGRLHPKKGLSLLLKAFSQSLVSHKKYHLLLAGPVEPPYLRNLQRQIHSLDLTQYVTFAGPLYGSMKSAALSAAQLFCLPSFQENFGVSVAEALSIGLPVSISSSVNISPRIASSYSGIVHEPNLESTASALRSWHSLTFSERMLMSQRALDLFAKEFHWKHSCAKLSRILYSN